MTVVTNENHAAFTTQISSRFHPTQLVPKPTSKSHCVSKFIEHFDPESASIKTFFELVLGAAGSSRCPISTKLHLNDGLN